MRISPTFIQTLYAGITSTQASDRSGVSHLYASSDQSFDKIIIHSPDASVLESRFASELGSAISAEVRRTASPEKLESLQTQIQSGSYRINTDAVASKILLMPASEEL